MQQQDRQPSKPSPPSIEGEAIEHTLQLIRQANRVFGLAIKDPQIIFDLKGQTAGMVKFLTKGLVQIRYNNKLLEENREHFLTQTLVHEVAHIVARTKYGRHIRPHGQEWQHIMIHFGARPQRCHSYDVSRTEQRKMRRFNYKCQCRSHQLTTIRHNRVRRGQSYICRHCSSPLIHDHIEP